MSVRPIARKPPLGGRDRINLREGLGSGRRVETLAREISQCGRVRRQGALVSGRKQSGGRLLHQHRGESGGEYRRLRRRAAADGASVLHRAGVRRFAAIHFLAHRAKWARPSRKCGKRQADCRSKPERQGSSQRAHRKSLYESGYVGYGIQFLLPAAVQASRLAVTSCLRRTGKWRHCESPATPCRGSRVSGRTGSGADTAAPL